MSTKAIISDLFQSIDDDFDTLKTYVGGLNLNRVETFFFENICEIIEQLRNQSPTSLDSFILAHSLLEDQVIQLRRAGMLKGNLEEIYKYVSRIEHYTEQFESVHREMGSSEPSSPRILYVEKSQLKQKLANEGLQDIFAVELEADGINALDKYINKKYTAIVISTEVLGIDSVSLLKAMSVVTSANDRSLKIMVTISGDVCEQELSSVDYIQVDSDENTPAQIRAQVSRWLKERSA